MIPVLLLWLYRKYFKDKTFRIKQRPVRQLPVVLGCCILALPALAQESKSIYKVYHKEKQIGTMEFVRLEKGEDLHLRASSSIRAKFLFKVDLNTVDQALFVKGRLISSSVYRHVNGEDKQTKYTRFSNGRYQLIEGRDTQQLNHSSISYSMLMLYFQEPVQQTQVYSDAFQKFLTIKKAGDHAYRVDLPDGNHNIYRFKDGICYEIEVHRTMYTIVMKNV